MMDNKVDWVEKAKVAYKAYCEVYNQHYNLSSIQFMTTGKGVNIPTWEELAPFHQTAWINVAREIANSFSIRWSDTDKLVTAIADDFCTCVRPQDGDGIQCSKCGKPVF